MERNSRAIAHLDLDAFFVSVEVLKNEKFRGKPLIVGGGERGVVAACSYEARTFGIHSAMPMRLARRLCPQAIVIGGDYEDYGKYSRIVTEILTEGAPLVEKSSIDEFYLDLTGMDRFLKSDLFVKELSQKVKRETGLPLTYALAGNKLLSKVGANEVKPNGQLMIPFGTEKAYLAPLDVKKMPGIGPKTTKELHDMGVETIRLLSQIPVRMLVNKYGKSGFTLSERAQGIDETPVVPYHEQKSISTEQTFSEDTISMSFLLRNIVEMVDKIGYELRSQNKLTGTVSIKLRYANFDTVSKQTRITYTSQDHILLDTAKKLFEKLYDRRLLVRLLGVRFTDLIPGNFQLNMFDGTAEKAALYQAIDSIKGQFGISSLVRGSSL
ncbi:DNA polymerase IV [Pseudoflavitalea sp. X16]|uniref:DNA polymerase IV n=1 Tax=Paraflavitalea devenefica TaxID=2716334 RepID=UPI00142277D6|nr:DNA polymerase IV [Paraflavitalea devenefica]NII26202.1 DNA polymerase IV [Paraflavitalea devenefica]